MMQRSHTLQPHSPSLIRSYLNGVRGSFVGKSVRHRSTVRISSCGATTLHRSPCMVGRASMSTAVPTTINLLATRTSSTNVSAGADFASSRTSPIIEGCLRTDRARLSLNASLIIPIARWSCNTKPMASATVVLPSHLPPAVDLRVVQHLEPFVAIHLM